MQALQVGATTVEEALERYYELPEDSDSADEEDLGLAEAEFSDGDDLAYAGSQQHSMLEDDDAPFEIPMGASQCNGPTAPISIPTSAAAVAPVAARPGYTMPPSMPRPTAVPHAMPAAAPKGARPSGNADSRRQLQSQGLAQEVSLGSGLGRMDSQGSGQSALAGLGSQVCAVACCSCTTCVEWHEPHVMMSLLHRISRYSIVALVNCPDNC